MNPDIEGGMESMVSRYYVPLLRFVCGRLPGEVETAKDITQDIFLTLAELSVNSRNIGNFRGESSAYTWLCAIAKRRIIDHYRKKLRKIHVTIDGLTPVDGNPYPVEGILLDLKTPEEELLDNESCERVRSTLERLPPEQRYALILKYVEDFSVKEIARVYGKSPKATESLIFRAKKTFECVYNGGKP